MQPRRLVAVATCAAAFAAAIWQAPSAFDHANSEANGLAKATPVERSLSGGLGTDIDRTFLLQARDLLPPKTTYAVLTGPKVTVSTPVTLSAVGPFTGYWLLPRVQVSDLKQADWILSYGADLQSLGLSYTRVVDVSPGLAIAEVKRT